MDSLTDTFPPQVHKPVRQMKIIVIILIALFEALVIGLSFYAGVKTGEKTTVDVDVVKDESITVTGVIRSSGLSEDEKTRYSLATVEYQITDFSGSPDIQGYFLLPDTVDYSVLLGTCVSVQGFPGHSTDEFMYGRQSLAVLDVQEITSDQCSPYGDTTQTGNVPQESRLETFTGTIISETRPAPDIGYDYGFLLDTPYLDEQNASGLPQSVSIIVIVPAANDIWRTFQNNMNAGVKIEGYMLWGYAESKYFLVTEVKK